MNLEQYIENKTINIPYQNLKYWLNEYGLDAVVKSIAYLIKTKKINFPYKKYFLLERVPDGFTKLMESTPSLLYPETYQIYNLNSPVKCMYQKKYTILLQHIQDYYYFGMLSDIFQESQRIKAKRYDHSQSLYDQWISDPTKAIRHAISKFHNITTYTLRESAFAAYYEVGFFRPKVAHDMYSLMNATSILDPCAGWGDRLLAAIASPKITRYIGVDPNKRLFKGYAKIEKYYTQFRDNPIDIQMLCDTFEDVDLDDIEDVDLVFTSPPYFALEMYHADDMSTQSNIKYKRLKTWLEKFLFVLMKKAWSHLKPTGFMIIVINDYSTLKIVEPMLEYASTIENCKFKGCISYAETGREPNTFKSPQPMWIWKKVDS